MNYYKLNKLDNNTYQLYGIIKGFVYNINKDSIGNSPASWRYDVSFFNREKQLIRLHGGGLLHVENVEEKLNRILQEEIL